ncbi:hypothetical protein [Fusibacter bizertensis]
MADFDFQTAYDEQLTNTAWLTDSQLAELSDGVEFSFIGVNEETGITR